MKLNAPTKELIVTFVDNESQRETDEVYKYILEYIEYESFLFDIGMEGGLITVKSNEIDCLSELLTELFSLQQKTQYDFKVLIKMNIVIDVEDMDVFDFVNTIFSKPFEDAEFMCLTTKFIMYDNDIFIMVSIGMTSEKYVSLELSESIDQEVNLQVKYDKLLAVADKIIKHLTEKCTNDS